MLNHINIIFFLCSVNMLSACAVCYGAPDDPVTIGLNKAILFLLLTIIFVLSCIVFSIIRMIRNSNKVDI